MGVVGPSVRRHEAEFWGLRTGENLRTEIYSGFDFWVPLMLSRVRMTNGSYHDVMSIHCPQQQLNRASYQQLCTIATRSARHSQPSGGHGRISCRAVSITYRVPSGVPSGSGFFAESLPDSQVRLTVQRSATTMQYHGLSVGKKLQDIYVYTQLHAGPGDSHDHRSQPEGMPLNKFGGIGKVLS